MTPRGQAPEIAGGTLRERRLALYVLCVGMLMIVLDVTIVNVALPAIQEDLHFSTSSLAWVVNAYLIAFGGLLLLAGRIGDLVGRRRIFLAGIVAVHLRLAAVRGRPELLVAGGRPFRAGRRRGDDLGGDPGDDRDDVPRAARAGQGDRGVRIRGLGRRLGRPGGGRNPDAVDQLALDLLREPADRYRHDPRGAEAGTGPSPASACGRARTFPAPC